MSGGGFTPGSFEIEGVEEYKNEYTVFCVPLHDSIDEYDLKLKLQKYGKLERCYIRPPGGVKPRRAICSFEIPGTNKVCSKALNGKMWRGLRTWVFTLDFWQQKLHQNESIRAGTHLHKLFVRQIPHSLSLTEFRNHFRRFGSLDLQ